MHKIMVVGGPCHGQEFATKSELQPGERVRVPKILRAKAVSGDDFLPERFDSNLEQEFTAYTYRAEQYFNEQTEKLFCILVPRSWSRTR